MTTAAQIEAYLHQHIPLSRAMAVRVAALDERGARLSAPLAPNLNHCGTVFGGSAAALAMLAGWALVYARIAALPYATRLVIRRSQVEYDRPIDGDFEAWCPSPDSAAWSQFDAGLAGRGKGRLDLRVDLLRQGAPAGSLRGQYVALRE